MLPRAVGFVLVILLFSFVDVNGLSNKTIWDSLNQLFNKGSQKLVLLLRSHSHKQNSIHGVKNKNEKGVRNIEEVIKNQLEKLPYENVNKKDLLRKCTESIERKCQRLQSCFYQCMRLRGGSSFCKGSCQKKYDAENDCGTAETTPVNYCDEQEETETTCKKRTTTCSTKKKCTTTCSTKKKCTTEDDCDTRKNLPKWILRVMEGVEKDNIRSHLRKRSKFYRRHRND